MKPDISFATKSGHFYLLTTLTSGRSHDHNDIFSNGLASTSRGKRFGPDPGRAYASRMLPRKFGALFLSTSLLSTPAGSLCHAQIPLRSQQTEALRYHVGGGTPGKKDWTDPSFNDSTWPAADKGRWPMPPFYSDGIVLVRVRVPVRADAANRLSLRLNPSSDGSVDDIYVNGQAVDIQKTHSDNTTFSDSVYDLHSGQAMPGSTATITFRVTYPPVARKESSSGYVKLTVDETSILHLENRADHVSALLASVPILMLNSFIVALGLGLFAFWRRVGGRDILLCSAMLISYPLFQLFTELSVLGVIRAPDPFAAVIYFALQGTAMAVTVEFIWTVYALHSTYLRGVAHAAWIIFNCAALFTELSTQPSFLISSSIVTTIVAAQVFNVLTLFLSMWALLVRKDNRLIAAALSLISIASMAGLVGKNTVVIGPFKVPYFDLTFFLCELALFTMLGRRAWKAWRARDELRVEFEAAREVQQQLVVPARDVPGFKVESVYAPAKQVGGDFFRVVPEPNGNLLIVVGDVSGKGLRAAMIVSSLIGVLRTLPMSSPSTVLATLNRSLAGQLHGGFVTCCVALISRDGKVTFSNAGHLSPYHNGEELPVVPGLPLGIDSTCEYEERYFILQPRDSLTFVSDGVIEARSVSGELFGFDRMLKFAKSSAKTIAQKAIDFGQDDDITVVTLTRVDDLDQAVTQLSQTSLNSSLA